MFIIILADLKYTSGSQLVYAPYKYSVTLHYILSVDWHKTISVCSTD